MQTDIYYRDVTRTENLEDFLMERLEAACGNFFKYDSAAHLTVRVETDRHRTGARKPSYTCEVILKPTKSKGVIKIRKSDVSFKRAVALTVSSLKTVLRRHSSKRSDHRKYDPMLDYVPEWGEEQQLLSVIPA
ncbi:HPF/RaiA family ribosome-associated protein [Bdellovibrio sp. NC01]|uniref:HPF/RaiA family ribosome-associated protein n=1 Tax=Bdellovibrio sp. NC01 TaxID=2220073 RepID=UPI00143D61F0|nr:HPF/RaiA family ribosome-associated protein [Bdellovibrio sp. NC01]